MRNFSSGATVSVAGGGILRLILVSPTGEKVYHDLTPAEAEAIREALPVAKPAAENQPTSKSRAKSGKEN